VIFGNGYNSVSGTSQLIILDAITGALIKRIDTGKGPCNGLSSSIPVDPDFDGLVDYVYAGDLQGNLWKFDLTDAVASNWDSAYREGAYTESGDNYIGTGNPAPLFQARGPGNVTQPITSRPDVMRMCNMKHGYMVVFGTGRWMGELDFDDTSTQTIYGIWDYGDDDDDSEYLGYFDRSANPVIGESQLSNQVTTVSLLQQAVEECDPNYNACDGDFFVVGDWKFRVLTDNMEGVESPWEASTIMDDGTTCGEPGVGNEECDPNGYGPHSDPLNLAGWYFDLPMTGERVVSGGTIRQGGVIIVGFAPSQSPCGSGGNSVLMEMDACSGGRFSTARFDIDYDGKITQDDDRIENRFPGEGGVGIDVENLAPTGILAEGQLQNPAFLRLKGEESETLQAAGSVDTLGVGHVAPVVGISYWLEFE
jgi:Tfp pilus tip-associated adhesin PilY1